MNLLEDLTPAKLAARSLAWDNPPPRWEDLPEGGIRVHVPARVDYFQAPIGDLRKDDAPYLWTSVDGDFSAVAHVRPNWTSVWDAGALMVRQDSTHWAKLCYESTDLGTTAAVSVVTNATSDDANGANLQTPDLWLQVARVGNAFGMHYSFDGHSWQMVRVFRLAMPASVKVGLVAQCPGGPGAQIDLLGFWINHGALHDLRKGI
jgi:regulation of enolase protein 1 (concanavalin A-like superfamily)